MALVDIENFLGGSWFTTIDVQVAWAGLRAALHLQAGDSIIVGTS
jgi:hypothetical protein